jgi:excisionase family DNA binding protein
MTLPVILVVDGAVGRHLAAALSAHIRELRRDGLPIPPALAEIAAVAATGGQARPSVDDSAVSGDPAAVDQLAFDYRAAADRLGVSDRSVRRLVADGKLDAVEVAGCKRIRAADLENYVAALPAVGERATQ